MCYLCKQSIREETKLRNKTKKVSVLILSLTVYLCELEQTILPLKTSVLSKAENNLGLYSFFLFGLFVFVIVVGFP